MNWNDEFYNRINSFKIKGPNLKDEEVVSIKIRAETGCFHRSCCPYALEIIENEVLELKEKDFQYIEHESGPEILAYIGLTTVGITLVKSVIDLITTIIKARFEGQRHGDGHKGSPVTLIIRTTKNKKEVIEEKIMTFNEASNVTNEMIEKLLHDGYKRLKDKEK